MHFQEKTKRNTLSKTQTNTTGTNSICCQSTRRTTMGRLAAASNARGHVIGTHWNVLSEDEDENKIHGPLWPPICACAGALKLIAFSMERTQLENKLHMASIDTFVAGLRSDMIKHRIVIAEMTDQIRGFASSMQLQLQTECLGHRRRRRHKLPPT
jgi:hypothetical protein